MGGIKRSFIFLLLESFIFADKWLDEIPMINMLFYKFENK